jgi:hypothetical protein
MRREAPNGDLPSYSPEFCGPPPTPVDPLKEFARATGLSLPDDATTILGDRAVIAFGGLQIAALPDVAIRSHPGDLAAAQGLADTLSDHIAGNTGINIGIQAAGADLVLATSQSYAGKVAGTGSLGEDEQFKAAMGDVPGSVAAAGYADLSRIWPLVGVDETDDVHHLAAVGFWADLAGDVQTAQIRLVVS